MARFQHVGILFLVFIITTFLSGISTAKIDNVDEDRKVYIVYVGSFPKTQELDYSPSTLHLNMLSETVDSRFLEKSLIRSYKRSFNGFAASLTKQEMQKLNAREDVLLVIPSQTYHLHTTDSWDFMGFHQTANVSQSPRLESDIIIGVIDSGIWPESESFNDRGLGPVPKKWKGACQGGQNFTCNKKIIGARNYAKGETVRDIDGHGTHTASTAAGSPVENASFYGLAKGTARGGVPSARIAAYKACSQKDGCEDHAILAAFDDAIADGVDIISLSLGADRVTNIQDDVIAIGAFHAVKKGILTVHSAGNSANPGTVSSTAPWLLTVGASTTRRHLISKVLLGNGKKLAGAAINMFNMNATEYPLVNAEDASASSCLKEEARVCQQGCLDKVKVKGKIVLCATTETEYPIKEVEEAGGIGIIALDDAYNSWPFVTPRPYVPLQQDLFDQVVQYINSTKLPKANFLEGESVNDSTAPVVASFSSRGPNGNYPDILKPDITAPGVDILAAYPPHISPSTSVLDHRSVNYNFLSGTSMACPHVTGIAAYVKSLHPDWSPSAIKSAIMTTALEMDSSKDGNREAEFAYGSGHVNPTKAANPGLVYDNLVNDYIRVICAVNTTQEVSKLFGASVPCNMIKHLEPKDLNYPTLSAKVPNGGGFKIRFPRTLTNVGHQNSTYQVKISGDPGLKITVLPSTLSFTALLQKRTFIVTAAGAMTPEQQFFSASLQWSDGVHSVRSPIMIYTDFVL